MGEMADDFFDSVLDYMDYIENTPPEEIEEDEA